MDPCFRKKCIGRICFLAVLCSMLSCGCGMQEQDMEDTGETRWERTRAERASKPVMTEVSDEDEAYVPEETALEILQRLTADEGFRERVWYDAGIEEGDTEEIILQKLGQCESLELREPPYGNSIYSLEDLSYVPNLKSLTITISAWDDSAIEDFTPIKELSGLQELYLSYSKAEELDLSFLAQMDTIRNLYLPNCLLGDIAFLGDMPQLKRLSLYGTPVDDLSVLEKLPELVELSIAGNEGAAHIEAIGTLTQMQDLGLQDCGIEDISFLSNLKELRGVNLNGNNISDLTPLSELYKLERLGAAENRISDIAPISGLTSLSDLALDGNEISDISALSGMARLNQAGLSDNNITDLSFLADKKELIYVSVFGNPCKDLRLVLEVPLLNCMAVGTTDEEAQWAAQWMSGHHSEVEEFSCIDYAEGDLNEDGRTDIALVIDAGLETRLLYVLMNQADGSYLEAEADVIIGDQYSGGMRGDPFRGISMGPGYLAIEMEWGSSGGETERSIYAFGDGKLQLKERISVEDYAYASGYDVQVRDGTGEICSRYVIAMDGYRMVRLDLYDQEHPSHKAFPEINLYDMSYYIYSEKIKLKLAPAEALDRVKESLAPDAQQEELPWQPWQKENYELLKGVELPDYYYAVSGTEDFIYYDGLRIRDGVFFHVVKAKQEKGTVEYLVNDITGAVEER